MNETFTTLKAALKDNHVVVLKNGITGIVVSFNGMPSHIIFNNFTNPLSKWDGNGKYKGKDDYSIKTILDGTSMLSAQDGFKKKTTKDLPVLWDVDNNVCG